MNIVASSGWLEYFGNGPNLGFFSEPIERGDELLVPTISIFEVFKRVLQQKDETDALRAVEFMYTGLVADLTDSLALHAAKVSPELKIHMEASIMLATAREYGAVLWTQIADFEGIEGVNLIKRH